MVKKRKQYSAQQKVAIVRKHLLDKVPVSDICDEYDLQPTVFYRWQKQLFEQAAEACFQRPGDSESTRLKRQITELEAKLAKKGEVLGEMMEEYMQSQSLPPRFFWSPVLPGTPTTPF